MQVMTIEKLKFTKQIKNPRKVFQCRLKKINYLALIDHQSFNMKNKIGWRKFSDWSTDPYPEHNREQTEGLIIYTSSLLH